MLFAMIQEAFIRKAACFDMRGGMPCYGRLDFLFSLLFERLQAFIREAARLQMRGCRPGYDVTVGRVLKQNK